MQVGRKEGRKASEDVIPEPWYACPGVHGVAAEPRRWTGSRARGGTDQ